MLIHNTFSLYSCIILFTTSFLILCFFSSEMLTTCIILINHPKFLYQFYIPVSMPLSLKWSYRMRFYTYMITVFLYTVFHLVWMGPTVVFSKLGLVLLAQESRLKLVWWARCPRSLGLAAIPSRIYAKWISFLSSIDAELVRFTFMCKEDGRRFGWSWWMDETMLLQFCPVKKSIILVFKCPFWRSASSFLEN